MPLIAPSRPERLALFTLDAATCLPLERVPVYAEVVVRAEVDDQPVDSDASLGDTILVGLRNDAPDNLVEPQPRQRLADLLGQELARQLGPDTHAVLQDQASDFIAQVIQRARAAAGGSPLRSIDAAVLKRAVRAAIRAEAGRRGLHLEPEATAIPTLWAYVLGMLATDHAGYASFDLTSLPEAILDGITASIDSRRLDPQALLDVSIVVYPSGNGQKVGPSLDALVQGRAAGNTIVARIELVKSTLNKPANGLVLPSMQSPSLEDWRLSPGSFAANPGSLIGADGCETILPANLALQEFHFYQVVRLTDLAPPVAPAVAGQVRLGVVNEYRLAWYPLGHSLGQVLYSLPLAPGESVNLAIIDWTRRDEAQRKERTTVDEQLVHNEHRDRTIGETVDAAVHEYQHGSTFMGGIAGALGGSTGAGVAGGVAGSLGGSTSSSSGSRDISGSTVQKLSDNISQASSSMRELQSTVVVQSNQSEKEAIETRTVVNYNHSHALTILYYEVLRHFRIVTELVRRRPALLVKVRTDWFEGAGALDAAVEHRAVLAAALLDARVADGFDAAERLMGRGGPLSDLTKALPAPSPPPPPDPNPPPLFQYFTFEMMTGSSHAALGDHDSYVDVFAFLVLEGGGMTELVRISGDNVLNQFSSFKQPTALNLFTGMPKGGGTVPWASIAAVRVGIAVHPMNKDDGMVSFSHIKVTAIDAAGTPGMVIVDQGYEAGHLIFGNGNDEAGRDITLPIKRPAFPPPPPPQFPSDGLADRYRSAALITHLARHRHFYSRAIALGQEAFERSADLDEIKFVDGSSAFEHVENRPLEMVGDYLAYASNDAAWSALIDARLGDAAAGTAGPAALDERLVTLPTRGVFAEAKLGHCNASEPIDNTRFWDWQQSPIPHLAPEIAPTVPVTPQPSQPNLAPTNFPGSIVNIVNPPNAPDPTGLASALTVLGTPNLFRDMSGRAEVADVLKNLADNAVKVAGVAAGGQARSGGSAGSTSASGGAAGGAAARPAGSGGTSIGGTRAQPNQPSANNRDLQDFGNVLSGAQAKGLISPEAAQSAFTDAASGGLPGLQQVGDSYQRPAYTVSELVAIIGERIARDALEAQGHIVFTDWTKHVSGTGFDLVSYDRATGELWIVDNKAQFRGIGSANALTGAAYPKYEADLRALLKKWPVAAEADLALAALDGMKIKMVVSNGFAGEATRFTAGLFEKGLYAFDVRAGKLFSSHADWKAMYDALGLKKGVRRVAGVRGAATVESNLLVAAVALGVGMYMLSSGMSLKELASDIAAQFAFDTLLSRLPGGGFAAAVVGLESDESPAQRQTRIVNEQIDAIMDRIPGTDTLSDADKTASRDAVRELLLAPIIIEDPTASTTPPLSLPGFTSPLAPPSTSFT